MMLDIKNEGQPLTAARFKQSRAIFVIRKIVTAAVTLLFFALISRHSAETEQKDRILLPFIEWNVQFRACFAKAYYAILCYIREVKQMTFADAILKLRSERRLSQTQFAKELGVSYTSVNRWENGRSFPTKMMRLVICRYCEKHHLEFSYEEVDRLS